MLNQNKKWSYGLQRQKTRSCLIPDSQRNPQPMKNLILFLSLLFLLSCKEKTISSNLEVCGIKDPVRNLPWLKAIIEDAKAQKQDDMLTVTVGKINGEIIFDCSMIYMSCIGCMAYHCDGTRLDPTKYTQEELKDFLDTIRGEATRGPVIWPEK